MSTQGWKLVEWYTAALSGGLGAAIVGMFVPQMGWFEFNSGFWAGVILPMALLMVGVYRYLPLERSVWFYGSFGLLAGVALAGLVPLTNPSLSAAQWVFASVLVAAISGVVALVFFGVVYQMYGGRLPRLVVVVVFVVAIMSTGFALSDLLGQFTASFALVGLLIGLLVLLNGVAIQDAMEWDWMTQRAGVIISRVAIVAVLLVGVAIVVDVVP